MHDYEHMLVLHTVVLIMIIFFCTFRSTFDHSFGRYIFWIQDDILVHLHCTDSFPCNHRKLVGLTLISVFVSSRELGRQRSTIELDTPSVKPAQLQALEEAVNEKIREHVPVSVQLLSIDDPAVEKVHIQILYLLVVKYRSLTVRSVSYI